MKLTRHYIVETTPVILADLKVVFKEEFAVQVAFASESHLIEAFTVLNTTLRCTRDTPEWRAARDHVAALMALKGMI